jgi:hypothetical protein
MARQTDKKRKILVEKSLHPSPGCPKTTQEKCLACCKLMFIMLPQNAAITLSDVIDVM